MRLKAKYAVAVAAAGAVSLLLMSSAIAAGFCAC